MLEGKSTREACASGLEAERGFCDAIASGRAPAAIGARSIITAGSRPTRNTAAIQAIARRWVELDITTDSTSIGQTGWTADLVTALFGSAGGQSKRLVTSGPPVCRGCRARLEIHLQTEFQQPARQNLRRRAP